MQAFAPSYEWAESAKAKQIQSAHRLVPFQLVMSNTRNKNIVDLILRNCSIISEVCIAASLGSSDHSSLECKVTWNSANLGI